MRYLVLFSIIVAFSTQAMAQRIVLFEEDEWEVVDFVIEETSVCFARRTAPDFGPLARIFFLQRQNRAWSLQLSADFDEYMPEGSALRASYTFGNTNTLKNLPMGVSNTGFFFSNASRRSAFAKHLTSAGATTMKVLVQSNEGSKTFDFDLPKLPEMIQKIRDCVAAKRAQAKK